MKALVTGAEGFVGPYLIEELLNKDYDVIATHRDKISKLPDEVIIEKLDILDKERLKEIFEQHSPDWIFHLAAISNVGFSIKNPEITMNVNVEGTKNILDMAEEMERPPAVLIIGSAQEYGTPKFIPITEEHPLNPTSPYAESKIKCEKLARERAKRGYNTVVVRSFNHIGPGQLDSFVASSFAKQVAEIEKGKRDSIKVGNLEAERDFTDVRDIVRAYVSAIEKCEPGEPYNVCSGNGYKIQWILDKLIELSDVKVKVERDPSRMRPSDIPVLIGSNKKFFAVTNWLPKINIEESLKDILDYWRKNI